MRMMNRDKKVISIMVIAILFPLIVQAAAAAESDSITISCAVPPHKAPDASFTANVTSGDAPLAVQFTDTSLNSPISWIWDFGDGVMSTEQNPIHTYSEGIFTVSLTVTCTTGSSQIVKLNYIHVSSPSSDSGDGGDNPSDKGENEILSIPNLEQDLLAPPQEDIVISQTMDLSYVTVTSQNGEPTLNIDLDKAQEIGATVTVQGNTVTITHPGFTLVIVSRQVTKEGKSLIGQNVQSITLSTTPQEAVITGVGLVSVSLQAGLSSLPEGASITISLAEPVNPVVLNAFGVAMTNAGKDIQAVAYILVVTKTNIATTLPATITMTCPPDWINNNGGKEAVSIVRIGDEGSMQVLETSFAGTDLKGNMIFEAKSPAGLSLFGLVTAKATAEKEQNPEATIIPVSRAAISTNVGMSAWIVSTIQQNPLILVIVLAVLALVAYFGWWKRRL